MTKLYIANCTKQHNHFHYRVIGSTRAFNQTIEAGKQVQLSGDFQQEDIDSIIQQHEAYGLIDSNRVKSARNFVGLCYSIGKPVTLNAMEVAFDQNTKLLDAQGQELRKMAALAASQTIHESAEIGGFGSVAAVGSSVIEESQSGGITERYEVLPEIPATRMRRVK